MHRILNWALGICVLKVFATAGLGACRGPYWVWCPNLDVEAHPSVAVRYQFAHGWQAVELDGIPAGSGCCFLQSAGIQPRCSNVMAESQPLLAPHHGDNVFPSMSADCSLPSRSDHAHRTQSRPPQTTPTLSQTGERRSSSLLSRLRHLTQFKGARESHVLDYLCHMQVGYLPSSGCRRRHRSHGAFDASPVGDPFWSIGKVVGMGRSQLLQRGASLKDPRCMARASA